MAGALSFEPDPPPLPPEPPEPLEPPDPPSDVVLVAVVGDEVTGAPPVVSPAFDAIVGEPGALLDTGETDSGTAELTVLLTSGEERAAVAGPDEDAADASTPLPGRAEPETVDPHAAKLKQANPTNAAFIVCPVGRRPVLGN